MKPIDIRQASNAKYVKSLDTDELREDFLIENLFHENEISLTYSHIDRIIIGGVLPVSESVSIGREYSEVVGTDYFLERREMGVINVGGSGMISVDGKEFVVQPEEALYIGSGAKQVVFTSIDKKTPAKFYFNSTPAHCHYPTRLIGLDQAQCVTLGEPESSNRRTIHKLIVPDVLQTCQLSMGLTKLDTGSLWNTMPCHTHERRMEVYFYFDMDEQTSVFHLMGEPQQTRHIVVRNEQAVISPSWSIHSGVGTKNYTFIWGMCGENQTFDDMDHVKVSEIR